MFLKIVKSLIKLSTKSQSLKDKSLDVSNKIIGNNSVMSKESDADFKLLLSLYSKNKKEDTEIIDIISLIKGINPLASENMCPYCKVTHVFNASRARKCPNCLNKMIVRQGFFLTGDQVNDLQKEIENSYAKQMVLSDVKFSLENAQNHRVNRDYTNFYRCLAESFRYMAQIENQIDDKGFSFWDKAWNYYNNARLEEMKSFSKDMGGYSSLPDIFWNMSNMLLDQSRHEHSQESKEKYEKQSLTYSFNTMAESIKLGKELYNITDIYKFQKKLIQKFSFSRDEVFTQIENIGKNMKLNKSEMKKYTEQTIEMLDYQVIE
jgi:hypothetical protein